MHISDTNPQRIYTVSEIIDIIVDEANHPSSNAITWPITSTEPKIAIIQQHLKLLKKWKYANDRGMTADSQYELVQGILEYSANVLDLGTKIRHWQYCDNMSCNMIKECKAIHNQLTAHVAAFGIKPRLGRGIGPLIHTEFGDEGEIYAIELTWKKVDNNEIRTEPIVSFRYI